MSAHAGTWYWARSWRTKAPWRLSTKVSSSRAMPRPMVMPPISWDRARVSVDDPADREHAEQPRHPHLPGRRRPPRPRRTGRRTRAGRSPLSACHVLGGIGAAHGAGSSLSMSSQALTTAEPQLELVPIEPPARDAGGQRTVAQLHPHPVRWRRAEGPEPRSRVSAVRAPVPMSAAAIRTTKPPLWTSRGRAGTAGAARGTWRRPPRCRSATGPRWRTPGRGSRYGPAEPEGAPRAGSRPGCGS